MSLTPKPNSLSVSSNPGSYPVTPELILFGLIHSLEGHDSCKRTHTGLSSSPLPTEFQSSRNMSISGSVLGVEDKPERFTIQELFNIREIFYEFQLYVEEEKPGLKRFYKPDGSDKYLSDCATRSSDMARKLVDWGCPPDVAAELTFLTLWDLVVLIGTNCLHMFVRVLCSSCPLFHSH